MPLISVIIPAYNQSNYLGQTLDSVKNQSFDDWECIIINDGSTDNTDEIANRYVQYDPRFKYIHQNNMGLSGARNTGLKLSRGSFICFLDSDDTLTPDMLEKTLAYLDNHPSVDIVYGAWDTIDENGRTLSKKKGPIKCDNLLSYLILTNLFPVHTLLSKRPVFDECGYFDIDLRALEDWDMWLRATCCGFKFGYISDVIAHYRQHASSMTRDVDRLHVNVFRVLDKFFNSYQANDKEILKPYAYIYQLVYMAMLYNIDHRDNDSKECLENAEKLYENAVYDKDYSVLLERMLRRLPFSNHFRTMIYSRTPILWRLEIRSNKYLKKAADSFADRYYPGIFYHGLIACLIWPPNFIKGVNMVII